MLEVRASGPCRMRSIWQRLGASDAAPPSPIIGHREAHLGKSAGPRRLPGTIGGAVAARRPVLLARRLNRRRRLAPLFRRRAGKRVHPWPLSGLGTPRQRFRSQHWHVPGGPWWHAGRSARERAVGRPAGDRPAVEPRANTLPRGPLRLRPPLARRDRQLAGGWYG